MNDPLQQQQNEFLGDGQNDAQSEHDDDQENVRQHDFDLMVECQICNRKFNEERIVRHQEACRKAAAKQKEREKILRKKAVLKDIKNDKEQMQKGKEQKEKEEKSAKWRQEHEAFIEVIKYNRKVKDVEAKGGDIRNLTPPEAQVPHNFVFCESCKRRFDPKVAERHIPKCKSIISKPKPPGQALKRRTQQQWTSQAQTETSQAQTGTNFNAQLTQDNTIQKWSALSNLSNKNKTQSTSNKTQSSNSNPNSDQKKQLVMSNQKQSNQSINQEDSIDSKYQTQTTINSKLRGSSLSKKKNQTQKIEKQTPQNLPSDRNDYLMKTTEPNFKQLPELKGSKYQNWTNIGNFAQADCQQRAILISNTQCPHCNRKFMSRAAERHIPICEKLTKKVCMNVPRNTSVPKNNKKPIQLGILQDVEALVAKQMSLKPPRPSVKLSSHQVSVQREITVKDINDTFLGSVAKFCTHCGSKFAVGHKYCGGCGKKRENEITS